MRLIRSLILALSFTLVIDRAVNGGDVTMQAANAFAEARDWVWDSGRDAARTMGG